jgi:hypothetical protein
MIGPIYTLAISLIKFSILFFYRRLFAVRRFQLASTIVGIACCVWLVVGLVGGFLYCIPMQSFWNPLVKGHCFNYDIWFLVMEIIDLLLDVVILCLPLKMIAGLHLPLRKRVMLSGIFLLGSL